MDRQAGRAVAWRRGLLSVFVLALAARLAAVLIFGMGGPDVSDDARAYHDIAVNLITRQAYVTDSDPPHRLDAPYATRPPLTPWLLAAVYSISGPSWRVGQLAMVLVGAVGCVLIALLGRRLFEDRVGLAAGVIAASYPFLVLVSTLPLTENLSVVLYVLLAICLSRVQDRRRRLDALGAGVILGLAALNKPTILAAVPLLAGWLLLTAGENRKQAATLAILLLAGTVATLVPWNVRNYHRLGAVFPVTTQAGAALQMANGYHADYPLSRLENGAAGWYDEPGSGVPVDGLSAFDADRKRRDVAWQFIRTHPAKFLEQSVRKLRVFWAAYPHPVHRVTWAGLALLSLAGVFLTRGNRRRLMPMYLLILQLALVHAVFVVLPRYRLAIEPFLIVFGAYALVWLFDRRLAGKAPVRQAA